MAQHNAFLMPGIVAGQCFPPLWMNYSPLGSCRAKLLITADDIFAAGAVRPTIQIRLAGRGKYTDTINSPSLSCGYCGNPPAGFAGGGAEPYLIGRTDPVTGLPYCPEFYGAYGLAWLYDIWSAHDDAIWASSVDLEIYGDRLTVGSHNVAMKAYAIDNTFAEFVAAPALGRQIQSWSINLASNALVVTNFCGLPLKKTLTIMDDGTSALS